MNVVILPNEYKGTQVYFTEKKVNTHIPNSTFNRIMYSTTDFMMNGIYIQFEMFVRQIDQNFNIYNCAFDPNHEHNQTMMTIFQRIEGGILDKWLRLEHSSASASASPRHKSMDIIQQLRAGVISVWKNEFHYNDKPHFQHFIIKISGVWENEGGCGLTYKFI
jgi:hypothetical protein